MALAHPEFVPDPGDSHERMTALQRELASTARFADDVPFDPARACTDRSDAPLVAGVDQAFREGEAISAIVVSRGTDVVERTAAVTTTEIPYIPGLLAFREGGPILAAFDRLDADPDVVLFDGNGRIHFRQAGIATHIGVVLDVPTVGVAKSLLCGSPERPLETKLPVGTRVPIRADDTVAAPPGTLIGYAVQTRQFETGDRHVNPVYVSAGHRVSAASAVAIVDSCCAGYKLPEPIRRADRYADEVKRTDA